MYKDDDLGRLMKPVFLFKYWETRPTSTQPPPLSLTMLQPITQTDDFAQLNAQVSPHREEMLTKNENNILKR